MMILRPLCALALMLSCQSASAAFKTGNQMYETCPGRTDDSPSSQMLAMGYFLGAVDHGIEAKVVCVPKNATAGQVHGIACRWLEKHPELRHYSATLLVGTAMIEAWPCPTP